MQDCRECLLKVKVLQCPINFDLLCNNKCCSNLNDNIDGRLVMTGNMFLVLLIQCIKMDLPHVYFGLIILFDHVILFKHEHSSD